MKPICMKCHRFFRIKKTGLNFIEGMPVENNVKQGMEEADKWRPYKIWTGDVWECKGCGAEIISGTGRSPISEKHHADFEAIRKNLNATFQVNDC